MTTENEEVRRAASAIAAKLRADPASWGQGDLAIDAYGSQVSVFDLKAECLCIVGHVLLQTGVDRRPTRVSIDVLCAMRKKLKRLGVASWNDAPGRTVEEIIELCEKVAA